MIALGTHEITFTSGMSENQISRPGEMEAYSLRRMLTRNHELLRELLLEAKKMYYTASKNMISIYVCDK